MDESFSSPSRRTHQLSNQNLRPTAALTPGASSSSHQVKWDSQFPPSSFSPTTYLVASNPEVLTYLLRDDEARNQLMNPASYTAPASAKNTIPVDFVPCSSPQRSPSRRVGSIRKSSKSSFSCPGSAHSTLSRSSQSLESSSPPTRRRNRRRLGTAAAFSASQVNFPTVQDSPSTHSTSRFLHPFEFSPLLCSL